MLWAAYVYENLKEASNGIHKFLLLKFIFNKKGAKNFEAGFLILTKL